MVVSNELDCQIVRGRVVSRNTELIRIRRVVTDELASCWLLFLVTSGSVISCLALLFLARMTIMMMVSVKMIMQGSRDIRTRSAHVQAS